jgi:hypothetical protein
MLLAMGRSSDARTWFSLGMEAARAKGDAHAAGELESALAGLD